MTLEGLPSHDVALWVATGVGVVRTGTDYDAYDCSYHGAND